MIYIYKNAAAKLKLFLRENIFNLFCFIFISFYVRE